MVSNCKITNSKQRTSKSWKPATNAGIQGKGQGSYRFCCLYNGGIMWGFVDGHIVIIGHGCQEVTYVPQKTTATKNIH